ncbi:MAG: hypothetical protein ACOVNR_00345 [Chitinophagaceae bacterium]
MLQWLYFFVYAILVFGGGIYLIKRSPKFASLRWLLPLLAIKWAVGCLYGWLFWVKYQGDDTWHYHQLSLEETKILLERPFFFIADLFQHPYKHSQWTSFFDSQQSFWKNLQYNILIKLLAVFNVFSKGHYYTNVLFFNLITIWGHYWLFKLLIAIVPTAKKHWLIIVCLFPPLLFWQSGIRKDGLIFAAIAATIYFSYLLVNKGFNKKYFWAALMGFLIVFLLRNATALGLLMPLMVYYVWGNNQHFIKYVLASFAIGTGLFFATSLGPQAFNLPLKLAERQEKFLELTGGSYMYLPPIDGSIFSYAKALPHALNHVFVRPYLWEGKSFLLLIAAIETAFFWLIVIVSLLFYRKQLNINLHKKAFVWLLYIAFLNYLIIGFTVPFAGAIVRYRIVFELCWLLPFWASLPINDWWLWLQKKAGKQ